MSDSNATIRVRVSPRASQNRIAGVKDSKLVIRVTAPPVDGKANAAVCQLIAKEVGVAKSNVVVIRGDTARDKLVAISGVSQAAAEAALGIDTQPGLF